MPNPDEVERSCRIVSRTIAMSVSETMSFSSPEIGGSLTLASTPIPKEAEEAMRQLYLAMVENDPDSILQKLAVPFRDELARSDAGCKLLQAGCQSVSVNIGGEVVVLDKEVFSVGRLDLCDVTVPASTKANDVSRIHCWIFNLSGGIVVVDGWSLAGTSLIDREGNDKEYPKSLPNERQAFIIPHGEAATLLIGKSVKVTLNPKLCVVCLERPRSVRLECGHQAFCLDCMLQHLDHVPCIRACPLCRAPVLSHRIVPAEEAVCHTIAVFA